MDTRSSRVLPWALRAAWAALALLAGPAFAAALDPRSRPVQVTASVLLWGVWAATLLASALLTPPTLTILRSMAPAGVAASAWAASTGAVTPAASSLAVTATGAACVLAFAAPVGYAFVNGPAYGDERRHPLRPPAPVMLALAPLVWAAAASSAVAAPLLLAAEAWAAGVAATAAAGAAVVVAARSLHSLSVRWAVLVPAGLVLKDPLVLSDPVLFTRNVVEALRPAPADTDSLDLTGGAPGLALELLLHEKVDLVLVEPRRRVGRSGRSARLLFTPTRPGRFLADAATARLPVG